MRRLILAATTVSVLLLAPLAPAWGQEAPFTVTVSQPGNGPHSGSVPVEVRIQEEDRARSVKRVHVELVGRGVFCDQSFPNDAMPDGNLTVSFGWNTGVYPSPSQQCSGSFDSGSPSSNGAYTIRATVWLANPFNLVEPRHRVGEGPVTISNGVGVPSGLAASYDKGGDEINVSWNANGENDPITYRVQECVGSGCSGWETLVETGQTAITVPPAGSGTHRYRVAAMRPDGTGGTIVSGWSSPAETTVPKPPKSTNDDSPTTTSERAVEPVSSEGEPPPPEPDAPTSDTPSTAPLRVERSGPRVAQRQQQQQREPTEVDRGFRDTLPYDRSGSGASSEASSGRALAGDDSDGDLRGILIPLAGGFFFLALAGHVWYLNHRSGHELATMRIDDESRFGPYPLEDV